MAKNNDVLQEPISLHTGFIVAIQREDGGPWTHGSIIVYGTKDHSERSNRIYITNHDK